MNPPSKRDRASSRKAFTTETQLKDAYQVERLLNRLTEHDLAKDTLQELSLSPQAKEQSADNRIARTQRKTAPAKPHPNRPREDFITYQRELAASHLMQELPPLPPQRIPKITGGFRADADEAVPQEFLEPVLRDEPAPAPVQSEPVEGVDEIFGDSGADFDPY